jgi:hypothetical protein
MAVKKGVWPWRAIHARLHNESSLAGNGSVKMKMMGKALLIPGALGSPATSVS